MKTNTIQECEFLRQQAKRKFDKVRGTWCDLLRWALPHKAYWILSQTPGERKNQHIIDPTHILALRSAVAGFLEGNTSSTRPWARYGVRDQDLNENPANRQWLQHFTNRVMSNMSNSNFYHAAGNFYYDYHVVNTGAYYFEELEDGDIHVHNLIPGAYYVIDNSRGIADTLVREFSLNVKALVDRYGKLNKSGLRDWSNISNGTRSMYEKGIYSQMIDIVQVIKKNPDFDITDPENPQNRRWIELTYELGSSNGSASNEGNGNFQDLGLERGKNIFLERRTRNRKPFVVGKSTDTFEYGEKGATIDSLGLIKSLNKKAISKDMALEQIVNPAIQGPASLRKSYITNAPGSYIPLDAKSIGAKQKIESIFNISPAIGALLEDTGDLRSMIDKFYYADFLLYLTKNPKTRTAYETNAILDEQQRVIGPSMQSLNVTHNNPVLEYFADYTLFEDPFLDAPPPDLEGVNLKPEYISVFAQAQRAADLPAVDRYMAMVGNVAQIDPKILDKINVDKLADIYEDRLYLPSGLNNPQDKVEARREQAAVRAQQERLMEQTLPAVAKSSKDLAAAQNQG